MLLNITKRLLLTKKMPKKQKKKNREKEIISLNLTTPKPRKDSLFTGAIFFLMILLVLGLYSILPKEKIIYQEVNSEFISFENSTLVTMSLPAVDDQGRGAITKLTVEATPGSGRTLLDIENLLFWTDTEHSIRIARNVAGNITGLNLKDYDLIYNIHANASTIGGESAGAALTIATIAALEGKKLRDDVIITGKINHDGTIAPVSGILAKAEAAKKANATLFLVPLLQSGDVIYETTEYCEKFGLTEICSVEQIPQKVNVEKEAGITTKEVETIQQALKYFLED